MTIEQASDKFHWFSIAEDGAIELFLDHHTLSNFRMCEGYFNEAFVNQIGPRGGTAWPLEFGAVFHSAVEYLYESKAMAKFEPDQLINLARTLWTKADLDRYYEHKTFIALGGLPGFIALLAQYVQHYSSDLERLRPIATEVAFGKHREVPLGTLFPALIDNNSSVYNRGLSIRCYLTGRIDFLMDSGTSIGPMDHKTSAFFKNNPMNTYEVQEGMTGYVYATQHIIKSQFPELAQRRALDRMWMNFIQIKHEDDPQKRFRRMPLFKTPFQLEDYRKRQLRTFEKIFDLVINDRTPDWNTNLCNSWWYSECQFRKIHRQGTREAQDLIRNTDFKIIQPWNPETVGEGE